MAKIDFINGGRLSGLVGNVVFAGNQVRIRPRKRSAASWSDDQRAHRKRYAAVIKLYNSIKGTIVNPIWGYAAKNGLSAYNLFIRENFHAIGYDGEIQDPTMLKMSIGDLSRPFNIKARLDENDHSQTFISWKNDSPDDIDRCRDNLVLIFFNGTRFSSPVYTDFKREDESACVKFPDKPSWKYGKGSYVYVFFVSITYQIFSEQRTYTDSWVGKL